MPYRVHQAKLPEGAEGLGWWPWRRFVRYSRAPAAVLLFYGGKDLRPDLMAGLAVALVGLPQAIAYASIANLPPHYGLYSAVVASIVGSMWGSSRHLSTGPTNAASILMLSILAPMYVMGSEEFLVAASLMAILVGLFRMLFGLARLGVLVNFVSRAVLFGFTAGAGALIAINQLPHLLGLEIPGPHGTVTVIVAVIQSLHQVHGPSLAIGVCTLVITLGVNRHFRKLPGSLVALAVATGVVIWLGSDQLGVRVVGEMPGALPRPTDITAVWSLLRSGGVGEMLTGALAIALLGLVEAVSIARTISRSSGQRLNVNQEFFGQGLANIATGLLSGYTTSGSFTRSAVNFQSGAKTQVAGIFSGMFILIGTLLFAPYLASLPRAGLAGVLVLVAYGMVDKRSIARVIRTSRSETAVMIATFSATLLFPLEFAVLSGVIFSLSMYLYQSSVPRVVPVVPDATFRHFIEVPGAPECCEMAVMNIRGALFFGATQHIEETLLESLKKYPERRYLLLRLHGVDQCDYTGIEMLEGVVRTFRECGGDVYLVQARPAVREIMRQSGFEDFLGIDHFLAQEEAIDHLFEAVIDSAVCWYRCPNRVFAECQGLPKEFGTAAEVHPCRTTPIDPSHFLNVRQVEEIIETKDPLILDVREPGEYQRGHIPGAVSFPLRRVLSEAGTLPPGRPLLLICRAGRRSTRAMRILLDLGFEDLQNLKGGILSWKAANMPFEVE